MISQWGGLLYLIEIYEGAAKRTTFLLELGIKSRTPAPRPKSLSLAPLLALQVG